MGRRQNAGLVLITPRYFKPFANVDFSSAASPSTANDDDETKMKPTVMAVWKTARDIYLLYLSTMNFLAASIGFDHFHH